MNVLQAAVLGVVEGLTEFLPVSSTGHLTIAEKLLGLQVNDPSVTAFTAVIQVGAILAVILYFRSDILRLLRGFLGGVASSQGRQSPDFRFAVYVIAGSIPIGIVGLAAKGFIEGPLRTLYVVGSALILWSAVMVLAERRATQERGESTLSLRDALVIGGAQCIALVPGVSRSGATISAGLLLGLDRVAATRMSFFLAIPALTAAGALELKDAVGGGVGALETAVGTMVSFVVAYATIGWLLKFVARHSIVTFVGYRVALGTVVLIALGTGLLSAT